MSFAQHGPGLFVVRYDSAEALAPDRQRELELVLREASRAGDQGVVFVVAPAVTAVDPAVKAYWLGVTADPSIRLRAVAVVTSQPAVTVSARGFSTAVILRDRQVAVKPFPEEAAAITWVRELVPAP